MSQAWKFKNHAIEISFETGNTNLKIAKCGLVRRKALHSIDRDVQHELGLPAVARTLLPRRWKRMQTCRLRRPPQRPGLRRMQRARAYARFRDTLPLETRHGLLQRPARTACRPSGASGGPRPTVFPCAARSATGRERRGCHAHRWLPRSTGASSCAAQAPVLFLILCWRVKTCS